MKKLIIALAMVLSLAACKTVYLPSTSTTTNVKDSIALHIIDSVRITERSRYKDYGDLLKPLRIDGQRSHSTAWIDTTKNILNGELIEDPIEEKIRVVTKTEYRDSIQIKEVKTPYPVEVIKENKVYPKFLVITSILGIIETLILGFVGYLKLKGSGFFSKIFKK